MPLPNLVCRVMGAAFLVVAIWGFIDGSRVLIFHVNTTHNIVHLLSGALALACGFMSVRTARIFCISLGLVYALVAVLGFLGVDPVISLLHLNPADNWLHVGIAAVFLAAAFARPTFLHKPTPRAA